MRIDAETTLPVWDGRRGDGDIALAISAAASPAKQDEAMRVSHDFVIEQTGDRRAGPVQWVVLPRDEGLAKLAEIGVEPKQGLRDFLAASETSIVVVALAATDAPRGARP
jgi:hypothetical protein